MRIMIEVVIEEIMVGPSSRPEHDCERAWFGTAHLSRERMALWFVRMLLCAQKNCLTPPDIVRERYFHISARYDLLVVHHE